MTFEEAWEALEIGDAVTVSDGTPAPSANTEGWPYMCWRSHNFSGTLTAKNEGPPRSLQIDMAPNEAGSVIGYAVAEGVTHTFTAD
jgi:hypothetical protein